MDEQATAVGDVSWTTLCEGPCQDLSLGQYSIQDRLGRGNPGLAFKAEHVPLERVVVRWVLSPQDAQPLQDTVEATAGSASASAVLTTGSGAESRSTEPAENACGEVGVPLFPHAFSRVESEQPHPGCHHRDRESLTCAQCYLHRLAEGNSPGQECRCSWNKFFGACGEVIRPTVRSFHLPPADADDCVQSVWVEILAALPHFLYDPARGRFLGWVRRVAQLVVIDFLRHKTRERYELRQDLQQTLVSNEPDPASACEQKWTRRRVRDGLELAASRLSQTNYRIVLLRWIEGRDFDEIADLLNLTREQTRYRHHRAKRKLRQLFRQHGITK